VVKLLRINFALSQIFPKFRKTTQQTASQFRAGDRLKAIEAMNGTDGRCAHPEVNKIRNQTTEISEIEIKFKAKNQLLYTKFVYRSWKIQLYK
jgi:hypothetical protein